MYKIKGSFLKIGLWLLVLFFIAATFFGIQYFVLKNKEDQGQNKIEQNSNSLTNKEVQSTVEAVGKLMVLPTDEIPTLATVTDPEILKDQAFFAQAKKGDKVLIYTKAKKGILYDPIANKILEVAPINLGTGATSQ